MTKHTGRAEEPLGRLFVLGGFTLVNATWAIAATTNAVRKPSERPQGPAALSLVRVATNETLSERKNCQSRQAELNIDPLD